MCNEKLSQNASRSPKNPSFFIRCIKLLSYGSRSIPERILARHDRLFSIHVVLFEIARFFCPPCAKKASKFGQKRRKSENRAKSAKIEKIRFSGRKSDFFSDLFRTTIESILVIYTMKTCFQREFGLGWILPPYPGTKLWAKMI